MTSSGFRLITGAIVTALLVLFVVLILTTLMRFPMEETSADAAADTELTPAQALSEPAAAARPPDSELRMETAAASAPGEQSTPVESAATPAAPAAGIALTVQATPTRAPDVAPAGPAVLPGMTPASETSTPDASAPGGDAPAPADLPPADGLPLPTPNPAITPPDSVQLFGNANWINDLLFADDALWAATSGGALRWDLEGATAQSFTMSNGLSANQLTAVALCPMEGFGIVFGSTAGLQVFDREGQSWKQIAAGSAAVRFNDVSALACDAAQGILVVGYEANGLDVFRARPGRWSHIEQSDAVATQGVDAVAIGAEGALWVASGGSLARLQGTQTTTWNSDDSPLSGEAISALAIDSDNLLWVTAGDRLYRFDGETWDLFEGSRTQGDFPTSALVDVQPAQGGRVWLLSESAELCRFDPEFESCAPFYTDLDGMTRGAARSLAASGGNLAYGTAGQGSSLLDSSRWVSLAQPGGFPAGNRVFALATDANGFLWAATNTGVQQADPSQPQQVSYLFSAERDGVVATNVRALYADARGGVWLGGIGASFYDGRRWTHYTQADGLAGDEITAISEDGQGRIWFGTRTGLSIWTGTTFFNLTGDNGLPDSEILALAADGDSMWIGSAGGGLYRFERNQLQVLTEENVGLPSNRVTALLAPGDGSLLVGTDAGLGVVREGEVTLVDGLPDDRVTALAAGSDGSIWLGTAANGLLRTIDGETWTPVEADSVALPAFVRALAVDLHGGGWIAGDSGALIRVAP